MTRYSATAIEANGLHVILLLLVPILLTGIALWPVGSPPSARRYDKCFFGVPPSCSWDSVR